MLRRLALALLLSTMIAGAPVEVEAAPVIGAVAAFAATGPVAGFLVNIGLDFVATGVESLIKGFIGSSSSSESTVTGVDVSLSRSGVDPQAFVVGLHPTGGTLNYHGSWGSDGGTPNAYYVREIAIADLPMRELAGAWADDTRVTIPDMSGARPTAQGWPVPEFRSNGQDYMWFDYRDGTQTVASAYLRGKFGADPDYPYTASMVGRGRAVVTVTMRVNQTLYSAGVPDFVWETTGIDLYNVAKDSTAGGSGAHRYDDPSTWEPSSNLAVHVYNVLKGIYYGDQWLFGFQDVTAYQLPASSWIAAINECDMAVDLAAGGTEPQYSGGLEITVDSTAADVIEELLKGCAGRLAEIGGIYKPLVGLPAAPVYSFTDAAVVITREHGVDPFPGADETYNAASGSWPNRATAWSMTDAPAYTNADLEAEDGGQVMAPSIQFKAVNSGTQVQRLLKGTIDENRLFRRPSVVLPPEASELEPLDMVAWTSAAEGYEDKKFLILQIDDEPTYMTPVQLLETDPASFDWDPANDEQPAPVALLTPGTVPAQVIVAPSVVGIAVNDNDGVARRFGAEFGWDGGVDDVSSVGMQIRDDAGNIIVSTSTDNVAAGAAIISSAAMIPDQHYQGREIYYPASPRPTDWTDWLDFNTPNVLLTGSDIAAATITANKFDQDTQNLLDPVLSDIQGKLTEHDALYGDLAELVSDLSATVQSRLSGIAVQSNAQQAAIVQTQLVSIENQQSVATLETQVVAKIGPIGAGMDWQAKVFADPDGGTSTFEIAVLATNGEFTAESALQLVAAVDIGGAVTSQLNLMADRITMVTTSNVAVAAPFFTSPDGAGGFYVGITNLRVQDLKSLDDGEAFELDGTSDNAYGEPYWRIG